MLRPGDAAPDFVLKDADGQDARLSTLGGPILLFFYPKDDTVGCRIEARRFRDAYDGIRAHGATVVGVSMDTPEEHCAFRDANQLPFVLLSDPDGRVLDLYEAWRTSLLGRRPLAVRRCSFLIDEDGIIRRVYRNVNVLRHAKQVLQDLDRIQAQRSWGDKAGQAAAGKPERPADGRGGRLNLRRRERPPSI